MKRLLILLTVWLMGMGVISAQPDSRYGNCTPGYRDIVVGGTPFAHVPLHCGFISRVNEQGYLAIGTPVHFVYGPNSFQGWIVGTQWDWRPDGSIVVQYMVGYQGDIGVDFSVKEVAIDIGHVTQ